VVQLVFLSDQCRPFRPDVLGGPALGPPVDDLLQPKLSHRGPSALPEEVRCAARRSARDVEEVCHNAFSVGGFRSETTQGRLAALSCFRQSTAGLTYGIPLGFGGGKTEIMAAG
jgi:hypothetical protein